MICHQPLPQLELGRPRRLRSCPLCWLLTRSQSLRPLQPNCLLSWHLRPGRPVALAPPTGQPVIACCFGPFNRAACCPDTSSGAASCPSTSSQAASCPDTSCRAACCTGTSPLPLGCLLSWQLLTGSLSSGPLRLDSQQFSWHLLPGSLSACHLVISSTSSRQTSSLLTVFVKCSEPKMMNLTLLIHRFSTTIKTTIQESIHVKTSTP
jgi:hypothetical protein